MNNINNQQQQQQQQQQQLFFPEFKPRERRGSKSQKIQFHKLNTVDSLFAVFYGFQSGSLLIQIKEGRNFQIGKSGISSIFLELQIEKQKLKTNVVNREISPYWNEEFCFDVKESNSELIINACSTKKIGWSKTIASLNIPLKSLTDGNIYEGWYSLISNKKEKINFGDIYLKLQYTSEVERHKDYLVARENTSKLMEILLHQDIVIIATLCRVYESEELSKTIIRIFNAEGQALRLLIQLIYRDLKSTTNEETLFRNDSMSTKTTRNYFRMIAIDYLNDILTPLILEILKNPKGFEIDPRKLPEGENLQENIERLRNTVQNFLDIIISSVDKMPLNMRKFFNLLRQLVKQCFPNSQLRAIGNLLWLRFLVPIIISPHIFGLIKEEITESEPRRALMLIGKILQILANQAKQFKEDFMMPLNSFLTEENAKKMLNFYETISIVPSQGPPDARRSKFTEEDKVKCLSLIVGQLDRNINIVEQKLFLDPRMNDQMAKTTNLRYFTTLKDILKSKETLTEIKK